MYIYIHIGSKRSKLDLDMMRYMVDQALHCIGKLLPSSSQSWDKEEGEGESCDNALRVMYEMACKYETFLLSQES